MLLWIILRENLTARQKFSPCVPKFELPLELNVCVIMCLLGSSMTMMIARILRKEFALLKEQYNQAFMQIGWMEKLLYKSNRKSLCQFG